MSWWTDDNKHKSLNSFQFGILKTHKVWYNCLKLPEVEKLKILVWFSSQQLIEQLIYAVSMIQVDGLYLDFVPCNCSKSIVPNQLDKIIYCLKAIETS